MHWAQRGRLHDEWYRTLWALLCESHVPLCQKVDIQICIFFKFPRKRDTDNYTATAYKLVLDSLKQHTIPDDTPDHVVMHPVVWMTDKANPRTEIMITEIT